jgi:S-adenosylmethionine decarboxylase
MQMQSFTSSPPDQYFEGPEKKLEVYFSENGSERGLMQFGEETWAGVLEAAACTILHRQSSPSFDAYLLSESSLFVFPHRVILKTCGATTLLLALPQLMQLAATVGSRIELVQYGHLRYNYPDLQLFPHGSFVEERAYLERFFSGAVHTSVLGQEGSCWYMLSVEQLSAVPPSEGRPHGWDTVRQAFSGDDILEIAMDSLSAKVCDIYSGENYGGMSGQELSRVMTARSGLADLLPGVHIDPWAFEPCGYSMNGLREQYYYTVHVTPERDFSYASFETNDPRFREPALVERVVGLFAPSQAVMTLTTRRGGCALPAYEVAGFEAAPLEVKKLGAVASVCCASFPSKVDSLDTASSASTDSTQTAECLQVEDAESPAGRDSPPAPREGAELARPMSTEALSELAR